MSKLPLFMLLALVQFGCSSDAKDDAPAGGSSSGGSSGSSGRGAMGGSSEAGDTSTAGSSEADDTGTAAGEGGEGGSTGRGGSAGNGGSAGKGSTGGASSSADLATTAVDGCQTPDMVTCSGDTPIHYECDNNPSKTPPEQGCIGNEVGINWCCPDPLCSRRSDYDGLCTQLDATKTNAYTCHPKAPGIGKCVAFSGGVYCCP